MNLKDYITEYVSSGRGMKWVEITKKSSMDDIIKCLDMIGAKEVDDHEFDESGMSKSDKDMIIYTAGDWNEYWKKPYICVLVKKNGRLNTFDIVFSDDKEQIAAIIVCDGDRYDSIDIIMLNDKMEKKLDFMNKCLN